MSWGRCQCRMGRLLLLLLTLVQLRPSYSQSTWGVAYELTSRLVKGTYDWVGEAIGMTNMCPFAEEFVDVARDAINAKIRCQDRALTSITNGLAHWEVSMTGKDPQPLVLAMTGPTGVGKTETAQVLARAILTKNELDGGRLHPRGLLVLRGEDYSDPRGNSTVYVERIKGAIFAKAMKCMGHGIVIFDEIQKVVPGTLEALAEAMSEHPTISHYAPDGTLQHIDTSRFIFILISDIGLPEMMTLLLEYDDPESIPPFRLATKVKQALDAQWSRLKFGKMVDKVVPFLPLSKPQLRTILDLKLQEKSAARSGELWLRLDVSPEVRDYLVEKPFIKYECYFYATDEDETPDETAPSSPHAKGSLHAKGEEEVAVERRRLSMAVQGDKGPKAGAACANGQGLAFAEFGARNLEIGGPLQALESAMVENIKPWRPLEVLDVRLDPATGNVELRWCAEEGGSAPSCQLMWAGDLAKRVS